MKRLQHIIVIIILSMVLALLITSCADGNSATEIAPEPTVSPTPEQTPEPTPEPTPTPTPEPEIEDDPYYGMRDYLGRIKPIYLDIFITGNDYSHINDFGLQLERGANLDKYDMVFEDATEENNKYFILYLDRLSQIATMFDNGEINHVDVAVNLSEILLGTQGGLLSRDQFDTVFAIYLQYISLIRSEFSNVGEEFPRRPE